jgi:hypothetical protein
VLPGELPAGCYVLRMDNVRHVYSKKVVLAR